MTPLRRLAASFRTRPVAAALLCAALLGLLMMTSACQQNRSADGSWKGQRHEQTQRGIKAAFTFGELHADLPASVSVPAARAAAESSLRARGYVIKDAASTSDGMRVVGVSRVGGRRAETTITAGLTNFVKGVTEGGTHVMIDTGSSGDEGVSRALLDDMLVRIGR